MPSVTLTFSSLNFSAQVGDTAYYTNTTASGGFTTSQGNIVEMGVITSIGTTSMTCEISNNTALPTTTSFILFSKENMVNLTSMLGYYSEVEFTNNDLNKAELFATACEVVESSK